MSKKPKNPANPRRAIMALKIALSSGGKKRKAKALELAQTYLDETEGHLLRNAPWKYSQYADGEEQALAWNLSNVDFQDCDDETKQERRMNLLQAYISENYREISDPEPWWQELIMNVLRGMTLALGASIVFGFFFYLVTGQI